MYDESKFFWDKPYLFISYVDRVVQRYVIEVEMMSILEVCNSTPIGGYVETMHKILQYGTIGLSYTKMYMAIQRQVSNTKGKEVFHKGKNFQCPLYWSLSCLLYGTLISWALLCDEQCEVYLGGC